MKKKLSIALFVISTLCFIALLFFIANLIIACKDYLIVTSADMVDAVVFISVYAFALLIISGVGLGVAIPCAILAFKKPIKICSYIQIAAFSLAVFFGVFELLQIML